jgi:single-strand DNA-binding protein
MSLNKVMLIGCLDDKPQVREVEGGQKMVGLSVVTTRHGQDAETSEQRQGREWHRVVIIDERLAAFAETYLGRDDQVYIEGQLHTERWQDDTYQWRSLTKILLSQDGGQLRRLSPDEASAEVNSSDGSMLAAAREAHLIETPSDETWLGRVA